MSTAGETDLLSTAYRRRFVVLLFLVCLFNLADRTVFSVMAPLMRVELGLTDAQIGILQGLSFALLYGGLGLPVGRLAERSSRVRIIAVATAIWSAATALSGFAFNYATLLLTRIGVGMGEAGFTAPTSSLVADHFPPQRRASAMGVIMLGLPVGTIVGAVGGGLIGHAYGWRVAFYALGAAGLVVAGLAALLLREPSRGLADGLRARTIVAADVPPLRDVFRHLFGTPTLRHVVLGGAICAIGIQGVAQFMPLFFVRQFSMPIAQAASLFGLVSGGSLAVGLLLGALGTDRAAAHDVRWPALGPAIALAITPVLFIGAFAQTSVLPTVLLLIGGCIGAMIHYGPTVGLIQNLTPVSMRSSAAAIFAMLYALVGTGIGPTFVGVASDLFAASVFEGNYAVTCAPGRTAPDSAATCAEAARFGLARSLMLCVLAYGWGAIHYFCAVRSLARDSQRAKLVVAA
ncbi:MAG: MFS transporter [Steroidobacteraceae bacterium]